MKRVLYPPLLLLLPLALGLACGLTDGSLPFSSATPTRSWGEEPGLPPPTATAGSVVSEVVEQTTVTAAPVGFGDIEGELFWNDRPAAEVTVLLCEQYSFLNDDCLGESETTMTASNGGFSFREIPAGEYNIAVRFPESDEWLLLETESYGLWARFAVTAEETLSLGPLRVQRNDLQLLVPAPGETLSADGLTLAWEPYDAAAYYELYLAPEYGDAVYINHQLEESQVVVDGRLFSCAYAWRVTAYNEGGTPIAESEKFGRFTVTDGEAPCAIEIIAPADDAAVGGNGLLLEWTPHPLAASYRILMWYDSDPEKPNILDFVEAYESDYTLSPRLAPGRYVWSVSVYDASGARIAESPIVDFMVEP